jgi:hypothetical protein
LGQSRRQASHRVLRMVRRRLRSILFAPRFMDLEAAVPMIPARPPPEGELELAQSPATMLRSNSDASQRGERYGRVSFAVTIRDLVTTADREDLLRARPARLITLLAGDLNTVPFSALQV